MPEAFVLVGPHVRLDRGGMATTAPGTADGLLRLCAGWAAEVGWTLAVDPRKADAVVVGPGVAHPPFDVPVAEVQPGQGIDGFRWALRHVAFHRQLPPKTLRYGRTADHVADLRRPDGPGPHRCAVLLHGGFWGDAWRRDLMDGIAVELTRSGWATWNVEYRRLGSGGGWPATGNDVRAAVDAVARIEGVVADKLLIVGHSAGAQLALWVAGERPELVAQVVSLAGLCDLEAADRQDLGRGAAARLLGGEPASSASPLDRLPLGVPVILATATADPLVPADQTRRYADAATAAGDPVKVVEVEGDDHFSFLDPAGDWTAVAAEIRATTET